jgi:hypothetical protein
MIQLETDKTEDQDSHLHMGIWLEASNDLSGFVGFVCQKADNFAVGEETTCTNEAGDVLFE